MIGKLVIAVVVIALSLTATTAFQYRIDALREEKLDEELLYLPNEKLLTHLTAGMHSVIADILWLRCIQYTVKEFHSRERKFRWLEHMCKTIVRLDPHFVGAYQYGATLLGAIGADDAAYELLQDGIRNNPDTEELPYEMAKLFILNRRDTPGSQEQAIFFLAMAAEHSDRPDFFTEWAYNLQVSHNLEAAGQEVWRDVLERSENEFLRELAERKLTELAIRHNVRILQEAADLFEADTGQPVTRLDDLVQAGYVDNVPARDPIGGEYLVLTDGRVANTTILLDMIQRQQSFYSKHIERFEREVGRKPMSLAEILEKGYSKALPPHPIPGLDWGYDPATGAINPNLDKTELQFPDTALGG